MSVFIQWESDNPSTPEILKFTAVFCDYSNVHMYDIIFQSSVIFISEV